MENLPDALNAMPQLAPGLILGALAGIGYGLFEDHKADDGIPHRWWQYGGLGVILGGLAWIVLINIS
jgi:hypothetical protein